MKLSFEPLTSGVDLAALNQCQRLLTLMQDPFLFSLIAGVNISVVAALYFAPVLQPRIHAFFEERGAGFIADLLRVDNFFMLLGLSFNLIIATYFGVQKANVC